MKYKFDFQNTDPKVRKAIEDSRSKGYNHFVIYPYGNIGRYAEELIVQEYHATVDYVIDEHLADNKRIYSLEQASRLDHEGEIILICSDNPQCFAEIRLTAYHYFDKNCLTDVFATQEFETAMDQFADAYRMIESFQKEL